MMWAGDTAQTISRGSSFSFSELKAFMYRLEVRIFPFYTVIYAKKTYFVATEPPSQLVPYETCDFRDDRQLSLAQWHR